jgi:hypothetical protein
MSYDNWEGDRDLDEYKGQDWKGSVFGGKHGHDDKYRGVNNYDASPNSNNFSGGFSGVDKPSHGKRNGAIILLVIGLVVGGVLFVNDIDISSITQEINEKVKTSGIFDQESNSQSSVKSNSQSSVKSNSQSSVEPVQEFASITTNLSGGAAADITINELQVVEKNNYKIINMNMKLTVNMKSNDMQYFSPSSNWYLKNENGEQYMEQCHNSQGDFMLIKGKENPISYYDICYHVEKKFNNFNFHGIPIILK